MLAAHQQACHAMVSFQLQGVQHAGGGPRLPSCQRGALRVRHPVTLNTPGLPLRVGLSSGAPRAAILGATPLGGAEGGRVPGARGEHTPGLGAAVEPQRHKRGAAQVP